MEKTNKRKTESKKENQEQEQRKEKSQEEWIKKDVGYLYANQAGHQDHVRQTVHHMYITKT